MIPRLARLLRRWANRLDKPQIAYDHTPCVFINDTPGSPTYGTRIPYTKSEARWSWDGGVTWWRQIEKTDAELAADALLEMFAPSSGAAGSKLAAEPRSTVRQDWASPRHLSSFVYARIMEPEVVAGADIPEYIAAFQRWHAAHDQIDATSSPDGPKKYLPGEVRDEQALRELARMWSYHPDFRPEWTVGS